MDRTKPERRSGGRCSVVRRVAAAWTVVALVLTAAALFGALQSTAEAGGPGGPPPRGTVRPWYTPEGLRALLAGRSLDVRSLVGPMAGAFTHPHDGRVAQPKVGAPPIGRPNIAPAPAAATSSVPDAWSPAITWAFEGTPTVGIHSALLPDGRLMFVAVDKTFTMTPTPLGEPLPAQQPVEAQLPPLEFLPGLEMGEFRLADTLYCTAQTLLSDGRLFTASGSRVLTHVPTNTRYILGLGDALIYDGSNWSLKAPMRGRGLMPEAMRWYPTATRLASGKVLVTAGYESVQPWVLKNLSAEVYDPASNTWTLVTPYSALPEQLFAYQYTHVLQLPVDTPRGDVLAFGDPGVPGYMKPDGTWTLSSAVRPGSVGLDPLRQNGGSTSMLPLRVVDGEWGYHNGSVIMAGGQRHSFNQRRIDVYDPIADAWVLTRDMGVTRFHTATVVLPDSRILILGGEDFETNAGLGKAQYVDPRNGFSVAWGTDEYPEVRGYHNVALLLPDGRVLFGSGNQNYTRGELPSFRYYYPSYMFQPRPTLAAAQPVLSYGSYGWLTTGTAPPPAEVVLIGLGVMTHSFDMNQRSVQLPILYTGAYQGLNIAVFGTPANTRVAPPGYYMLFILDENRVPSVAKIVQLQ